MRLRLTRDSTVYGVNYHTRDGRYRIQREVYHPWRWYINEADGEGRWCDAEPADGFETLSDARLYLSAKITREGG